MTSTEHTMIVSGIEIPSLNLPDDNCLSAENQTLSHSPSEPWIFAPIAVTIQKMTMKKPPQLHETNETKTAFFFQTLLPFLAAGLGLIAAGLLLEKAETMRFFTTIPDVVTLVPTLLGLKGNLEMTLGSRLSTLANLGFMDTGSQKFSVAVSNLALIQCQAIMVSSLSVLPAALFGEKQFNVHDFTCLLLSTVATAAIAAFLLGTIMILVVIISKKYKINPDNIVTPVAATLGDVVTLGILLLVGTFFLDIRHDYLWLLLFLLFVFYVIAGLSAYRASQDQFTTEVLRHGWWAVFAAMLITLGSGFVLKSSMHKYPPIAAFQPLVNGVGGNLVGVQASRISTGLHRARKNKSKETSSLWVHASCWHAFVQNNEDSITSRILIAISVPGNFLFITIIFLIGCGFDNNVPFTVLFLLVGLIQVIFLLYLCQFLVRAMWKMRIDPDNSAIPILTAIGDLIGATLLITSFTILVNYFKMDIPTVDNH
ncbi:unnamed protein product [Auanema sp. JU1783]|nr:unnamed protein product [Auanema sp. JU1783]